jgi:hypothetical protein
VPAISWRTDTTASCVCTENGGWGDPSFATSGYWLQYSLDCRLDDLRQHDAATHTPAAGLRYRPPTELIHKITAKLIHKPTVEVIHRRMVSLTSFLKTPRNTSGRPTFSGSFPKVKVRE